ncbi:Zinc finger, C2H2 type family protein [Ditylenchus destructor]|nr:Zinc finger, C2H2 type family protein [Ditylenchus destructor]
MFNSNGGSGGGGSSSSNHLMQIQRMVASRQMNSNSLQSQRNNGFASNSNYNSESNSGGLSKNDMGMYGGSNSQSWSNRSNAMSKDNGFMFGNGSSSIMQPPRSTPNMMSDNSGGFYAGNSSMRQLYIFKCPECNIIKNSCDDLEVHIKTEHLNWFPFHCPLCTACRASDAQMREHIHSHHKKNDNKYLYIDNPMGKRMLQEMMDRALFSASTQAARNRDRFQTGNHMYPENQSVRSFVNGVMSNSSGMSNAEMLERIKRHRMERRNSGEIHRDESGDQHSPNDLHDDGQDEPRQGHGVTVLAKKSSIGDDILAQIQQQGSNARSAGAVIGGEDSQDDEQDNNGVITGGAGTMSVTEGTGNAAENIDGDAMFADTMEVVDDETVNAQLSNIFGGGRIKSEFDLSSMEALDNNSTTSSLLRQTMSSAHESDEGGMMSNNMDVLQNVAQLFSADQNQGMGDYRPHPNQYTVRNNLGLQHALIRRRAPRGTLGRGQCISKKRVLGQCSKCQKPVTAGARQMHMFFHLGKDHNTYRFRCKHKGCSVEHYRKDQMENHQAKLHGKVDADMMEDRSLELHALCQQMSLELLGTNGNTPGPTAAKAQLLYDKMQQDAELSAMRKRRRGLSGSGFHRSHSYLSNNRGFLSGNNQYNLQPSMQPQRYNNQLGGSGYMGSSTSSTLQLPIKRNCIPTQRINEENLECLLCHKYIMNRIRGFHILWHLNNDLGIIRYNCRYCDFKHDRPQSVQTHGKKEHDDENCVEDSLYKFEDELKSMSKACFGVEQIFAKELRRRNKLERSQGSSLLMDQDDLDMGMEDLGDLETNSNDASSNDILQQISGSASYEPKHDPKISPSSKETKPSISGKNEFAASGNTSGSVPVKRKSTRRFGVRRPKSRKQKEEMAKLREVSMRLGGAQYFKKKSSEAIRCEKCGKFSASRLSDHAYFHLENCDLYLCPLCDLGHNSRENMVKHIRDLHNASDAPTDNRLKYAQEIKNAIRECYPSCFVDAPIPTSRDIDKLKTNLNLSDKRLAGANVNAQRKGSENIDDEEDNEVIFLFVSVFLCRISLVNKLQV